MRHPRKLVRDALAMASSQYLSRAALVVRGLAAAGALGPHGYGGWNALNLIFDYGVYSAGGALHGLDLELPPAVAQGDGARQRRLMGGAVSAVVTGGAAFAALVLLYVESGGRAFAATPGWGLPLLMLAAALLQLPFQYFASALRALGRIQAVSLAYVVQAGLGGALGAALVWRWGAGGLLAAWLAGGIAALAVMRNAGPEVPLRPGSFSTALSLARVGFPVFGYIAAMLVLRSADRLALVRHGTPEALGLYSLALMAAGLVLYVPEAAAYVLYPRFAAAREASDERPVRSEALRAHRALMVALPLVVALALVWAGPVVGWLLPSYRDGVAALRVLSIGALMYSGAVLPGYYLLAAGRGKMLFGIGAAGAVLDLALVFAVAARDPNPLPVAAAQGLGYSLLGVGLVLLAGREWLATPSERAALVLSSFAPALWGGAAALAACAVGTSESVPASLLRSAAVTIAYSPVLLWFGRGTGIGRLLHEWLAARTAA